MWEADYAGTSFLTPDKAGKLRFGSKICNFYADRTQPHGLATVAYELLTGRLPSRVYVPASRRNRRLSAAADDVLRRGLARDAGERYVSAQEFHRALAGILQRHPLEIAPAGALAATAMLAIAAGLLMGWIALSNNHQSRAPEGGGPVDPATIPAHANKGTGPE